MTREQFKEARKAARAKFRPLLEEYNRRAAQEFILSDETISIGDEYLKVLYAFAKKMNIRDIIAKDMLM